MTRNPEPNLDATGDDAWLYGPQTDGEAEPILYTHHQQTSRNPRDWLRCAEATHYAAGVLWERWKESARKLTDVPAARCVSRAEALDFELAPQAMLLSACAAEALIKAVLIAKLPQESTSKKLPISDAWRRHDLVELCKEAELALTESERVLLLRMKQHLWAGRFPVPMSPNEYGNMARESGVGGLPKFVLQDPEATNDLFVHLRAGLDRVRGTAEDRA